MKNFLPGACLFSLFFILTLTNGLYPSERNKKGRQLKKTSSISYTKFNINNISTYIFNNGITDNNSNGNSGLFYPKGYGTTAMYASGLIWGGKVDGDIRVGGSAYRTGMQPGKILSQGVAENPGDPSLRVYRVRPDYKTADLSSEINDGEGTQQEIKAQYEKDWNEWPVSKGAPFTDVDGNGVYDPSMDIPGVDGAAQTLWYVANDLDSSLTRNFYNSASIGIEMQVTVWGYTIAPFDNMIFKKYKLINKSGKDVTDMYISMWADPDLGDAGDDYVGCDTLLNLGYVYNANDIDKAYSLKNLKPPSAGFVYLQGPVVDGAPGDTAHSAGRIIKGKKNLSMTSFYYFAGGDPNIGDPPQGLSGFADGARQFYNYFQSRIGNSGEHFRLPDNLGGGLTNYALSGDPVTHTGWLDGTQLPAGDRRLGIASGPFTFAASDTQEVVFAEICAGAVNNIDRLAAISLLRKYTASSSYLYSLDFNAPKPPSAPSLHTSGFDQKIVLEWGDNINNANLTELKVNGGYKFQGYNVYQFSSADYKTAKSVRVATFDLDDSVSTIYDFVPDSISGRFVYNAIQHGVNSGLQRYFIFDRDYFTNLPMHNGTKYYFSVTAYNYNPNTSPRALENKPNIFTVIPQSTLPCVRYGAKINQVISVSHIQGTSKGIIYPVVIDPSQLTGDTYKIIFKNDNSNIVWDLIDVTTNTVRLENQVNQSRDEDYYIVDGILVKVINSILNPNTSGDEFTFTSPGNTYNSLLARTDVEKINVFPNPYYGFNSNEETNYGKFVTFSHLPQKATIRIFNLAGRLVKTLQKDNPDQFYRFYLFTDVNIPLGSGIYIAFIEMPELGRTKILKFAIITPQVVPDHF